jgi:hypothetical protein
LSITIRRAEISDFLPGALNLFAACCVLKTSEAMKCGGDCSSWPEHTGIRMLPGLAVQVREEDMTFLRRLFRWRRNLPVRRIRICVECGMPVGEHKSWCSILRVMQERPALARSDK